MIKTYIIPIIIIWLYIISVIVYRIYSAKRKKSPYCKICGTKLKRHGFEDQLECPDWYSHPRI